MRHRLLLASVAATGVLLTVSSSLQAQQPPPPPVPVAPAPLPPPSPIYAIPQALFTLADQPATHTSFTFDRSMLGDAEGLIDSSGQLHRAAAALSSITVDSYHYPQPAFYNPETMGSIVATYDAAGWKHLVSATSNPGRSAQPSSNITDMWLHFSGADIHDVAVLMRGPRQMNLIQIAGDLRPLDLLHLAGHFGIPRVDPDAVMVPAPPGH